MLEYCVMQTTCFLNESSVYRRMNYFLVRLYEDKKRPSAKEVFKINARFK